MTQRIAKKGVRDIPPDDDIPKYERAYRAILDRVKSGRYPVGARIPTEVELSSQFNVSRVTMRRALDILVRDGYVESKQGSGYTVLTQSPSSDTCLTSFTDTMLRAGREPTSRLLSIEQLDSSAGEVEDLPEDMRREPVTRVKRLRLVDGTPRMLVMTYAPTRLMQDAGAKDFPESGPGQSILRILSERFNLNWSAACEDISPVAADAKMAEIFNVEPGCPLLKQTCSAFDDRGNTVFHEDVFRTGSVSFNLSQQSRTPRYN